MAPQLCYSGDTEVLQGCTRSVTEVLHTPPSAEEQAFGLAVDHRGVLQRVPGQLLVKDGQACDGESRVAYLQCNNSVTAV
jgi:hypothetical protein